MSNYKFEVPANKRSLIDAYLIKFNKRADKIGIPTLNWSWGKASLKTVERFIKQDNNSAPESFSENILFVNLEIVGDLSVKFEDHKFIATLQHLRTGENIIRSIDNEVKIPVEYRTSGSNCQHCETNRYRKDTYLLLNLKDNTIIQCGSSCMKDLLGKNSPENLLHKAGLISELISFIEGTSTGGTGGDIVFPIVEFLAQTNSVIRNFGWISKAKSLIEGKHSTSFVVLENLLPSTNGINSSLLSKVLSEDTDKAIKANEWCESISDIECSENDYLFNIRAICRSGLVTMRTAGFAASIVSAYDKFIKATTGNINNNSQHIGIIKEKIELPLTLKKDIILHTNYGDCRYYIFNDDNSNVVVWKSTKDCFLIENKKYLIKGTIKEHNLFKNVQQTVLTRCEVLKNL